MRIVWDKELFHSWGNKPKQKAREKQYNAEYYRRNKWRWLDNFKDKVSKTISKEKQTQKKYQDIAEANLRKAAARAVAAANVKPQKKSSSTQTVTGGETENKKATTGRKSSVGSKSRKSGSAGKGKAKKGGAGGKGKGKGKGGAKAKSKEKAKKTKTSSTTKSASKNKSVEQTTSRTEMVYDEKGKLIDTKVIQKQKVLRIPKSVQKKAKKQYKKVSAAQIKKGKRRAKKILKKIKNRRS